MAFLKEIRSREDIDGLYHGDGVTFNPDEVHRGLLPPCAIYCEPEPPVGDRARFIGKSRGEFVTLGIRKAHLQPGPQGTLDIVPRSTITITPATLDEIVCYEAHTGFSQ